MPPEGILNIDKPAKMTSHDVVNRVRRLAGTRRVGHAGTLDPLATGVLLVCLGRATRLVEYLVGQPKCYETTIRLGQTTNTYDADGQVVADEPVPDYTTAQLEAVLRPFRGTIEQQPPAFSAIKQGGQPIYKLARQGKQVEVTARVVTIYELELMGWERPFLQLRVLCSAGTYIRSLAHDVGRVLGCGAHVAVLRRTAVGPFLVQQAVSLADLEPSNLPDFVQKPETAVSHLPPLHLENTEAQKLQNGLQIPIAPHHPIAPMVCVYNHLGVFIGIAQQTEANWRAHKMFV